MERLTATRNWIWRRPQTVKPIIPIGICLESSPQIPSHLLGILLIIETIGGRLPDVYDGIVERFSGGAVGDSAVHVGYLVVFCAVDDDAGAVLAQWGVFAVEGAVDGGCG
jgi:hypothetical protein